jgi:drug/metabolite transporter (DMT)-like permease
VSGSLVLALLTSLALIAFAANSLICRAALGGGAIDAGSFTALRLLSGAVVLLAVRRASRRPTAAGRGLVQPAMLFLYAAAFSFAYRSLDVGTGALLLFGAVQATMILAGLRSGERFGLAEAAGLLVALTGLVWLVAPGVTAPSPRGAALMGAAGVAWGLYSLRGRGSQDPVGDTARNFAIAAAAGLLFVPGSLSGGLVTARGAALAVLSGAVTSGLGYVLWFAALPRLSAIRAAILQLPVPAITAAGGVLFLGERVSARLVLAAMLILGGVGLAIAVHARSARRRSGAPEGSPR